MLQLLENTANKIHHFFQKLYTFVVTQITAPKIVRSTTNLDQLNVKSQFTDTKICQFILRKSSNPIIKRFRTSTKPPKSWLSHNKLEIP